MWGGDTGLTVKHKINVLFFLGKKLIFLKAMEHPTCLSLINMTSTTVEPGNMTTTVEQTSLEHSSSAKPVNSSTDIGSDGTTVSRSVATKPCKDA